MSNNKIALEIVDLEERIAPHAILAACAAAVATDGVDLPHKALGHVAIHNTEGTPAADVISGLAKEHADCLA